MTTDKPALYNFALYLLQKLNDENILVNSTQIFKVQNELVDNWISVYEHELQTNKSNFVDVEKDKNTKKNRRKLMPKKNTIETNTIETNTVIDDECPFTTPINETKNEEKKEQTNVIIEHPDVYQTLQPENYILQQEIPQIFKDLLRIDEKEKNKKLISLKKKYNEMLECLYEGKQYENQPINDLFYNLMENFAKGKFSKIDEIKELQESFFEEFRKIKLTSNLKFSDGRTRARHLSLDNFVAKRK
ncbi:MAG: hypothetical protein EBV03_12940 [Proteobacteria bacterium]|nr:hypothetical protein [Pseudomonadota bacterium]